MSAHSRFKIETGIPVFFARPAIGRRVRPQPPRLWALAPRSAVLPSRVPTRCAPPVTGHRADTTPKRVLDSAAATGVLTIDGQMIDAPLIRQAKRILNSH